MFWAKVDCMRCQQLQRAVTFQSKGAFAQNKRGLWPNLQSTYKGHKEEADAEIHPCMGSVSALTLSQVEQSSPCACTRSLAVCVDSLELIRQF